MAEMPSSSRPYRLPDDNAVQAQSEMNGVTDHNNKKINLSVCVQCDNAFTQENLPKLLPCLHTCCQTCITPQTDEEADKEKGKDDTSSPKPLTCPACNQEFKLDKLINNPFSTVPVNQDSRPSEDGSPSTGKFPICTCCEENQKASSFCIECQEWLCDPCVVAHKRVRMTKDHTFSTKMEQEDSVLDTSMSKQVYCPVHKTEKMKLFCLSCDKLTCRDCQLLEHKDHRYQFIDETIADQKTNLQKSIELLKKRLESNEKVAEKIAKKEKDIKRQQVDVFNEVRQVADQITNDLIRWCKQLLNFLQGVCNCRTRDLSMKKHEFDDFAEKAKHCIEFVDYAVESGNDMNILSVKGLMDSQLKSLLDKDISIQDSMFELNIKYENDVNFLKKNVSKMGFINVNGKSYPTNNQQAAAPPKPEAPVPPATNTTAPNATGTAGSTPTYNHNLISRAVTELLNMYPQQIRDSYKTMSPDQRRGFLQRLVTQHIRSQRTQTSLLTDLASYLNVRSTSASTPTQQSHNSDSNAIQELYRMRPQVGQGQDQGHGQRSAPVPQQANANYRGDTTQQPLSSPTAIAPVPGGQLGFNWPGFPGARQQNYYYNRPNHTLTTSPTATVPSNNFLGQLGGPGYPQGGARPPNTQVVPVSKVPTAPGVPPGRFNIDPLNLRLKQEPQDDSQYRPACQYSGGSGSRLMQSPPSSISPAQRASTSPGSVDGGGLRRTESPALPDVNVMDSDRNAILQNLNHHPTRSLNQYNLNLKHDPSDPSEDYCAVCHNGGDLLCCDRCPKVFHLQCHIPAISASLAPSEQWTCTMCMRDDGLVIEKPVEKDFEITSTGKRKAPSGLTDRELKACERVLLELFCLETSTCFHEPVSKQVPNYYKIITNPMDLSSIKCKLWQGHFNHYNTIEEFLSGIKLGPVVQNYVPNYYKIITNPMDLSSIKCKLRRGHFNHYNTIEEFLSDIKLVFKNCYTYNNPASEIYGVGKSIEAFFETLVQTYLPCYLNFIHRDIPSPMGAVGSLEGNGDAPRHKKRRSPAPDASRDSPVHYS